MVRAAYKLLKGLAHDHNVDAGRRPATSGPLQLDPVDVSQAGRRPRVARSPPVSCRRRRAVVQALPLVCGDEIDPTRRELLVHPDDPRLTAFGQGIPPTLFIYRGSSAVSAVVLAPRSADSGLDFRAVCAGWACERCDSSMRSGQTLRRHPTVNSTSTRRSGTHQVKPPVTNRAKYDKPIRRLHMWES